MILFYIICLALLGGIDQLGNTGSWQFIVLVVLAIINVMSSD
jgi:hypothetical protein